MSWDEIGQNTADKIFNLEKQIEDLRESVYQAEFKLIQTDGQDDNVMGASDSGVSLSNVLRGGVTLSPLVMRRIDG